MNASTLAQAERALSEGDVETALVLLTEYAEQRGRGEGRDQDDSLWESLAVTAIQMGAL
ncbi:MAG TPA: hypothetical protein VFO62_00450 [Candidatus Binatia bacterium]|nr:hypothetical protein [Candidatus Binatia bacterium]